MPFMEIDLEKYRNNIDKILEKIIDKSQMMAVVKSDAYGLGIEKMSKIAFEKGIRWFGIADIDEAKILRNIFNDSINILRLLPCTIDEVESIIKYNVIPIVSSIEEISAFSKIGIKNNKKVEIHLGVDTGMGRIGFLTNELTDMLERVSGLKGISIKGLFSHFPCADEKDESFTLLQLRIFNGISAEIEKKTGKKLIKHIANSSSVFRYEDSCLDLIRCGISMYGANPSSFLKLEGIKNIVSVKAKVILIKNLHKDSGVSYGRTFVAKEEKKIALIDIGYGKGFSRLFSSNGYVLIKGKKADILGRVTMDITAVDITDISNVKIGDEVVIIGSQGEEFINIDEYSSRMNTIPYEVFCVMGKILKRKYAGE
ncbi:MAG: alanine racemase [Candidatus Aureabacteria bacterium]|nr:alanine racemase [Candidatus Auribacterota bacterium]